MSQGTFQGIATILAMVAFLGVCWWAFSSHKKKVFDEAANLPFADEDLADEERQTPSARAEPSADEKEPSTGQTSSADSDKG